MMEIRRILTEYEPILARVASDMLLASWLSGANGIASRVPALAPSSDYPPPIVPMFPVTEPDDTSPVIEFPIIRIAAESLASRELLTAAEYYARDRQAKQEAFTITGVQSEVTLEKIQDALADDVAEGGTFKEFEKRVEGALDASPLAPSRLETIYRTNIASAYSVGQKRVLAHPMVRTAFPYVLYSATHDRRTRPNHAAMEHHGIGGTAIYRTDDPVILEFWSPWDFSCRCAMILLTLEMAAAKGIEEAKLWLETSIPPSQPEFVQHPPFYPPPGWTA